MFETLKWWGEKKENKIPSNVDKINDAIQPLVDKGVIQQEEGLSMIPTGLEASDKTLDRTKAGDAIVPIAEQEIKDKIKEINMKLIKLGIKQSSADIELSKNGLLPSEITELESLRKELEQQERALLSQQNKVNNSYNLN